MRKIFLLPLIFMAACEKSPKEKMQVPDPNAMKYKIDGIRSTEVYRLATNYLYQLNINYISGRQENLTLYVSGLPPGVKCFLSTSDTINGVPDFSTNLVFNAARDAALVENHIITLTATTASGNTRNFDIPITVKPVEDCSRYLPNINRADYSCDQSFSFEPFRSTNVPGQAEVELPDAGYVRANVDCVNNMIYIPNQTVNGNTTEGFGTFTDTSIDLSYTTIVSGGSQTSCSVHYFFKL